jgi:hypothetical protein
MKHPTFLSRDELESLCDISFRRASGPGGQNRNKVETAVLYVHRESDLRGQASESRTQAENRSEALLRLRLELATHLRTEPCDEGLLLLKRYIQNGRINIAATNWEWPLALAEILNRLATNDYQLTTTAEELGISSSQILKVLAKHPPAMKLLNDLRVERGLKKLQ